jgi:predicted glycoside hydrolase/deacetylase ChbG (UPF0249 family)
MHVNIRNNGTIYELPNDCAIEATSVITSCGAQPLNLAPITNPAIRGTLQLQKAFEELAVEAGVFGVVQSTTIMMNQPATDHAIELIKQGLISNVGLHVTLTSGKPVLDASLVPDLVDSDGFFLKQDKVIAAERLSFDQAYNEFKAEIPNGTLELMSHTTLAGNALLPTLSSYVDNRVDEFNILTSQALKDWLEVNRIECVSFASVN